MTVLYWGLGSGLEKRSWHCKNESAGLELRKTTNLEICGADGEDQLVGLEHAAAGRQDHVCEEGFLTERLDIVEEHRVMIIPFETKVLRRHSLLLLLAGMDNIRKVLT